MWSSLRVTTLNADEAERTLRKRALALAAVVRNFILRRRRAKRPCAAPPSHPARASEARARRPWGCGPPPAGGAPRSRTGGLRSVAASRRAGASPRHARTRLGICPVSDRSRIFSKRGSNLGYVVCKFRLGDLGRAVTERAAAAEASVFAPRRPATRARVVWSRRRRRGALPCFRPAGSSSSAGCGCGAAGEAGRCARGGPRRSPAAAGGSRARRAARPSRSRRGAPRRP